MAVAAVAAIAACGTTPAPSGSSGGSSGAKPATSLTVSIQNGQGQVSKHWTLRCGPGGAAGGSHPHAAAACRALLALKNPFAKQKSGQMCPMIVASDKRAVFNGTLNGKKVHATIIDGGCQLAKWSKLSKVMF
jgi:hypothetical protein